MVHFSKKKKMPEGRCWKHTVNCRSVLKEIIRHANERLFCAGGISVGVTLYANTGENVQNNLKKTIYQRLFLIF